MRAFPSERPVPALRCKVRRALCAVGACLLAACSSQEPGVPGARFQVHAVQTKTGPVLIRFDSATGRLTQAPLMGSQRWQPIGDAPAAAADALAPGRYSFDFAQAPSTPLTFFRLDTQTGRVWRFAYGRDRAWTALQDGDSTPTPEDAPVPRPRRGPESDRVRAAEPPPASNGSFQQSKRDVDAFVEAVTQGDLPVEMRAWAVEQLGNGPARDATGPLLEMLYDQNLAIARAAVRALARLEDERVKPALERLREDERDEIRRLARRALAERS